MGTALTHHVWETALISLPDPRWEETACAYLHPDRSTPSAYEVIAAYKTELAPHQVANAVRFMNEIPRDVVGKVLKRPLRET